MSNDKTGGSAFPQTISFSGDGSGFVSSDELGCGGIDMRDYFAAKALASLINHPNKDSCNLGKNAVPKLAKYAYEYADAMLAERAK